MKREFSLVSFAGGVVLGGLVMAAWFLGGPIAGPSAPAADATTTGNVGSASGVVAIENQPAGASVTVASVTVPPPGVWVAVREVSAGDLGNVLGAARVGGPRTDITVPLLRATEPGQTYAVELYRDSGESQFDLSSDSVYVDFDTGERVIAYFQTTN